jgi:hypothetical protein
LFEAGGYRKEDFPVEDLSLWLRLSRLGELRSVPSTLLNYRIGSNSVTSERGAEMNTVKARLFSEIGLNQYDVNIFINEFTTIRESYLKYPDAIKRIVLLYRDFFKLIGFLGLRDARIKEIQKESFFWFSKNSEALGVIAVMGLQKSFRDLYRKFN